MCYGDFAVYALAEILIPRIQPLWKLACPLVLRAQLEFASHHYRPLS